MRTPNRDNKQTRRATFETFESRLMMTANPVSDLDPSAVPVEIEGIDQIEIAPSLAQANQATGVDYVHNDYGFDGSGQTIAVIDSGIAWDHYALGGGYGENHKVVGGWDFAENDANPYDDGPVGFHGSHVAGIIGSEDSTYSGVASGADLVALRVFDDYGSGDFEMVEAALQWVHEHRNDFENPITTVNLSLGTTWNADSVPDWSNLEDEFALLESDGIFISVAAGNSFEDYGTKGLSYPASSEFVVPVASHDSNGTISDFSQRNERVLVAPGEEVVSTIPGHGIGPARSFYSASGTSMAAPYVAGASALLRQAMDFMGGTDIDQDALYDHFRDTADYIYDSVTKTSYSKINVGNAIDQIIGDSHGDTINKAFDLGNVKDTQSLKGTIGKISDLDYFTFKATTTGTASFTIDTTHDLDADVGLVGGGLSQNGDEYSFSVEAGKTYSFYVGTNDGIGHYSIDLEMPAEFSVKAVDWGSAAQKTISGINLSGESWYQFGAHENGTLTFELLDAANKNNVQFEIYDSQLRLIDSNTSGNPDRIDFAAQKGESYFVRFDGKSSDVDVRISNLIQRQNDNLIINGTNQSDNIRVSVRNQINVTINGVSYSYSKSQIDLISVRSARGHDTVEIVGSSADERAFVQGTRFSFVNSDVAIRGTSAETISLDGAGGKDRLVMLGTDTTETFTGRTNWARMTDGNYSAVAKGFERMFVNANSAGDTAVLYDSASEDLLLKGKDWIQFGNTDNTFVLREFEDVRVNSRGGADRAVIRDTAGNDHVVTRPNSTTIVGDHYRMVAKGFNHVTTIATKGGYDTAIMDGSNGSDLVVSRDGSTVVRSGNKSNVTRGFDSVTINTHDGDDVGRFYLAGNTNKVGIHRNGLSVSSETGNTIATGLNKISVFGGGEVDSVLISEIGQRDELVGVRSFARINYEDMAVTLREIEELTAQAQSGQTAHAELTAIDFLFSQQGNWE